MLQPPIVINFTAVRLSWEEVNCTQRNGVIVGYNIRYFIYKEPQPMFLNVTADDTNITIINLTEFCLNHISVAAINGNGIGPYSQEFSFYTSKLNFEYYIIVKLYE